MIVYVKQNLINSDSLHSELEIIKRKKGFIYSVTYEEIFFKEIGKGFPFHNILEKSNYF